MVFHCVDLHVMILHLVAIISEDLYVRNASRTGDGKNARHVFVMGYHKLGLLKETREDFCPEDPYQYCKYWHIFQYSEQIDIDVTDLFKSLPG